MTSAEPNSCQTFALRDGRLLAYQCYGQADGRPLYFFHGFPGSRLQAALLHEQALAAGVCLVAPDRPGFGRSTPDPQRTISGWSADVAQLADHLGHERFGVLGVSCGGPYALACASAMPSRLDYVGLLAGIGPMNVPSIRQGQLPLLRLMFAAARISPLLIAPLLLLDYVMFRINPERAVRALAAMLTAPDRQLLASDPQGAAEFGASLAEAYHQGIGGAMREAQLIGCGPDFALEDITLPVHIYQSGVDRNVPPAMGRYLAEHIPGGRLHDYPEEGHLSVVVHGFRDCLRDFLQ
jgi:pimeloyl-ACP methyl ester carboxylesterase